MTDSTDTNATAAMLYERSQALFLRQEPKEPSVVEDGPAFAAGPGQTSQANQASQTSHEPSQAGHAGSMSNQGEPNQDGLNQNGFNQDGFSQDGPLSPGLTSGQPTNRPSPASQSPRSPDQAEPPRTNGEVKPASDDGYPFNRPLPPQESALLPGMYKPLPEELLLEWVAPSRPFKKPNRRFFTTITTIGILISLILFFANQLLPVAVVIAVVFLAYVLFSIEPGDVRHQLTTYGIRIENQLYYWEELGRFWFTQQYQIDILHIEVARFPFTLHMLLGELDREVMTEILSEVLLNERPQPTAIEKAAKWLQDKVPLDLES